jgi:nanoRNase/pAp phosphatase (c-di-AMP/oligoRNAs hydrolase)
MRVKVVTANRVNLSIPVSLGLFLIFFFLIVNALAQPTKETLTREDGQNGVRVALTYLNPLKGMDNKELVFEVSMNTHSVNLDGYDFAKIMVLRDDKGNIHQALGAGGHKGGGHHRGGTVRFPGVDKEGNSILQGAKYFEILVRGVADVPERVLRWELPIE